MSRTSRIRNLRQARWSRPVGLSLLLFLTLGVTLGGFVCESEPNDNIAVSNFIRAGELALGNITPNGDGDFYRHPGAAAGDLVFAYVDTSDSTASQNSFLRVLGNDGSTIEEDDNSGPPGGLMSSSAIAGAIVSPAQAGNVFYQVFEFGDDDDIVLAFGSGYTLHQAIISPAAIFAESEANDTAGTANFITAPIMAGAISDGGSPDFFQFTALADAEVAVIVDDDPDNDAIRTDTDLYIMDTDGTTILSTGNNVDSDDANAAGTLTIPADGIYYVRIGDDGSTNDTEYRFVLLVNGVVFSDFDQDGTSDTDDNCPEVLNGVQVDSDDDGVGNACETCDFGILKTTAGVCGCAQPDVDIQGNGTIDCGLADPALALLSRVGLLLVPDPVNDRVMAFDPQDGDLVDANFIPADAVNLSNPIAAILAPDQNSILVSDAAEDLVQRFDLNGAFLGTFAPAGGVDLNIMDSPAGLAVRPNGNVVVCINSGANADAVAEFDAGGNHVGNFIAAGAGGLSGPQDIHFRANGTALVTGLGSNAIHAYSAAGASTGTFATLDGDGEQLLEAADGTVHVAVNIGDQRGIVAHSAAGAIVSQHAPNELLLFEGLAELGNGNLLITSQARTTTGNLPGGAFVMTRAGVFLGPKIAGYNMQFVEFALIDADGDGVGDNLDGCPADPNKSASGQCGCGTPDTDSDGDGKADCIDNCPGVFNADQAETDGDGKADACDNCPSVFNAAQTDADGDGKGDDCDNCPGAFNADQADADADALGDACDMAPPAAGCCAPGVFPVAGLLLPAWLLGWRLRRLRRG